MGKVSSKEKTRRVKARRQARSSGNKYLRPGTLAQLRCSKLSESRPPWFRQRLAEWFEFLGQKVPLGFPSSPYSILFKTVTFDQSPMKLMNASVYSCNDTSLGCFCGDCPSSSVCAAHEPSPPSKDPCAIRIGSLKDKQRAKIKERIDKFVKEKLLYFCDVLNIQINKANAKKEELSAKLLEFLESPHATTNILLADIELGWGLTVILGIHASPSLLPIHPMELFDGGRSIIGSIFGGFKGKSQLPYFATQCGNGETFTTDIFLPLILLPWIACPADSGRVM